MQESTSTRSRSNTARSNTERYWTLTLSVPLNSAVHFYRFCSKVMAPPSSIYPRSPVLTTCTPALPMGWPKQGLSNLAAILPLNGLATRSGSIQYLPGLLLRHLWKTSSVIPNDRKQLYLKHRYAALLKVLKLLQRLPS